MNIKSSKNKDEFGYTVLQLPRHSLKETQILDAIGEKFASGQIDLEEAMFVKSVFMSRARDLENA